MKQNAIRRAGGVLLVLATALGTISRAGEDLSSLVDAQYAFAAKQYAGMLERLEGERRFPRSFVGGLKLVGQRDWTSGFFPGSLWLLHEHNGEAKWRAAAEDYTSRLESLQHYDGDHDIGFMLYCSYGNGYRITGKPEYRDVLITGARTLCTRFHPRVGMIRSWDWGNWKYPVIIDNMMNLELLMFAHREAGKPLFREIALTHANTTLEHHYRPDGSSFHLVDFDPETGAVLSRETRQGFSDDSAWARGQTWGLYGFTMIHRLTQEPEYLAQALKIADFLITHTNMPADKVPYWDFNAPGIPNEPRDASAAAIMASALLELTDFVDAETGSRYRSFAEQQLKSLGSTAYRAVLGENGHFILQHSVGDLPRGTEVDAPLVYADYYFLEALARWKARFGGGK